MGHMFHSKLYRSLGEEVDILRQSFMTATWFNRVSPK